MTTHASDDAATLFHNLDAPFIRYDKNKIEPILWQAKDFVVQTHHEVKVPSVAGSTLKYSFSTVNGDISFSLQFMTNNHGNNQNVVEVIRESIREPSDVEPIKGSYKADYDGVFIFIFDNSYSWFTDKLLTYNIQLLQPAFAMADATRALTSRRLLVTLSAESQQSKQRLSHCQERSKTLMNEMQALESRLQALQEELRKKQDLLEKAQQEYSECAERIAVNDAKKQGLGIRCLEKKTLTQVLSYLGSQTSEAPLVCKYWNALLREYDGNASNGSAR